MAIELPPQMRLGIERNSSRCAATNIRKASRAISQFYDQALEPSGLKSTQFTLLISIAIHAPIALTQLAEKMVMDRTTLTRDLVRLEEQGLLETTPGLDRRSKILNLTAHGLNTLQAAIPLRAKAQAHIVKSIGEERLGVLLEVIEEVVASVKAA
jgi:DNA-binding MarR family transcriptional regulator